MPVEGQWLRVNAPLPRRDKRALAIAISAAVVAVVAAAVVYATRPPSDKHCVTITVASTMGGAVHKRCTR